MGNIKFEEILVVATIITGIIYFIDKKILAVKRQAAAKDLGTKIADPWYVDWAKSFFPVLLLVLFLRSFLLEPFRIPTGSMKPTLLEGDFILVNKFDYGLRLPILGTKLLPIGKPKRGDIVIFRHSDRKDLIKRVVGLPGDHIQYKDDVLYINDLPAEQIFTGRMYDHDISSGRAWPVSKYKEQLAEKHHDIFLHVLGNQKEFPFNDVIVPDNQYFVMGDNRDNSADSRLWGFVDDTKLMGRAVLTWMSWDGLNKDIRWRRLGRFIE